MLLVNLFGGPGAGKSTAAAYIFSQLKMGGVNAELVTEFAKDKVWEKNDAALVNQAYMFGSQYYRISRVGDQVDVVITDSPLLLSVIYNKDPVLGEAFSAMVRNVFSRFNNLNFFLKRVKKYNPVGRLQTESEADEVAKKIHRMLEASLIDYREVAGNKEGHDDIVQAICGRLGLDHFKTQVVPGDAGGTVPPHSGSEPTVHAGDPEPVTGDSITTEGEYTLDDIRRMYHLLFNMVLTFEKMFLARGATKFEETQKLELEQAIIERLNDIGLYHHGALVFESKMDNKLILRVSQSDCYTIEHDVIRNRFFLHLDQAK